MTRFPPGQGGHKPGTPAPRFWGAKGWVIGAVVFFYFLTGYAWAWHSCPADSFEVSNQATVPSLLAALGTACGLGVVAARQLAWPTHAQAQPAGSSVRRWVAPVLVVAAVAAAGTAWANQFLRYACFAPDRIVLHPDPFGPLRVAGWNRVTGVGASCWTRKGSRQLGLTFLLDTGERLSMEPGHGMATFRGVSAALGSQPVRYTLDASVTADNCPAEVYPALQRRGR